MTRIQSTSKLGPQHAAEIRQHVARGYPRGRIAAAYGISQRLVGRVFRGERHCDAFDLSRATPTAAYLALTRTTTGSATITL